MVGNFSIQQAESVATIEHLAGGRRALPGKIARITTPRHAGKLENRLGKSMEEKSIVPCADCLSALQRARGCDMHCIRTI